MTLDLVRRSTKGSPLTATDHDGNLDKLEQAIEAVDPADFATAAQGALADTAIQPGNPALTDAREWSAETIEQAEAEAGTATTRRAFTAQRVFQAVAAWWAASAASTKLAGIAPGATANSSDATLLDRANHTGTQAAATITGLSTVATSGAYSDLSGRPTLGTAAAANIGDFATAAQGAKVDTAVQPAALSGYVQTNDSRLSTDLTYDAATREVRSSTGADAVLPLATTSAAGLQRARGYGSITYAATVTLDMAALNGQVNSIALTGDLTLATSNLAVGQEVELRLVGDSSPRVLTFPTDWRFQGTKPANIPANKVARLSLQVFGTTNAGVDAVCTVQS